MKDITELKTFNEKLHYLYENPDLMRFALEEISENYMEMVEKFIDMAIVGKHLTSEMLQKAINGLEFYGNIPAWTLSQTNDVAEALGIKFDKFNEYDYNFIMNWYLSDMAEFWGIDPMKYGKYANFMLTKDPDNERPQERAYEVAKKFIKR